jgi:hypothetical protein
MIDWKLVIGNPATKAVDTAQRSKRAREFIVKGRIQCFK